MGQDNRLLYIRERLKRRGGDPLAGVSKDATSNKYVPSTLAQWNTTLAAAGITSGAPGWLWLLQEASGDNADSIGAAPLTNIGAMAYQSAVTGWTRKAMSADSDAANKAIANASDTALPQLDAESSLVLAYVQIVSTPGGDREVILSGDVAARVTAANVPKLVNGAENGTGAADVTTAVRPWVIRHNVTGSTTALFTDLEKVSATFAASSTSKRTYFGGALLEDAPVFKILYAVQFETAAAELSDAQLRTLLQVLGWSPLW